LTERKEIANTQLTSLKNQLKDIQFQIDSLESKKKEKLSFINEKDIQEKYFLANQELDELKKEIFENEKNVQDLEKILKLINELSSEEQKYSDALTYYLTNLKDNKLFMAFIENFNKEIKRTIDKKIYIKVNDKKPILELVNEEQKDIREGSTHSKLISILFDIILIYSYSKNFDFVPTPIMHDNVFADMEDELKLKLLKAITTYNNTGQQYIFTDFKDSLIKDIINEINNKNINVARSLFRIGDDYSNTLFGFNLEERV